MEIDSNAKPIMAVPVVEESAVCQCCGERKPISEFRLYKGKPTAICKSCLRKDNRSERFKSFTARELMDELKRRGYSGVLTKKVVEEFKL